MQLQRLLDLSEVTEPGDLQGQLISRANEMGFGLVMAAVVVEVPGAPAIVTRIGNTPEAFINSAESMEESARDPVLQRLKTMSVPVIYDQGMYVREGAADLWEAQAPFGYRTGIAVALHLPGGKHFMLGLDRDEALPKNESRLIRLLGDLQLLIVHAQGPALKMFGRPSVLTALSPREEAVLRLTSEGRRTKVIASDLFLSEATVRFHLQNAMRKLGVQSKHHAVRKAQALGLLV